MESVQHLKRYCRNALRPFLWAVIFCTSALWSSAAAQSGQVKGTVKDSGGEALIGASINVKGKTTGAMADVNGNFTLQAEPNDILVVSYVGYVSQEVPVN